MIGFRFNQDGGFDKNVRIYDDKNLITIERRIDENGVTIGRNLCLTLNGARRSCPQKTEL